VNPSSCAQSFETLYMFCASLFMIFLEFVYFYLIWEAGNTNCRNLLIYIKYTVCSICCYCTCYVSSRVVCGWSESWFIVHLWFQKWEGKICKIQSQHLPVGTDKKHEKLVTVVCIMAIIWTVHLLIACQH